MVESLKIVQGFFSGLQKNKTKTRMSDEKRKKLNEILTAKD